MVETALSGACRAQPGRPGQPEGNSESLDQQLNEGYNQQWWGVPGRSHRAVLEARPEEDTG